MTQPLPDPKRLEALGRRFAALAQEAERADTPLVALPAGELLEFLGLLDREHAALHSEVFWDLMHENDIFRRALQEISLGEEAADPGWSRARKALAWRLQKDPA